MIDVTKLDIFGNTEISTKVNEYKDKLEQTRKNLLEKRNKNLKLAKEAKKEAEKDFVTVLKTIEDKIMVAASKNRKSTSISCTLSVKGTYILVSLFQALQDNGFICKLANTEPSSSYHGYRDRAITSTKLKLIVSW